MGAVFTNEVYIAKDTEAAIGLLQKQGRRVIAAALSEKAETFGRFEIRPDDCFAIGNEGKGLTEAVISKCDFTAIIPMSGKTESLNAATASAMILWEAKRGG
jgi:TrmH family RNA methyltransferase